MPTEKIDAELLHLEKQIAEMKKQTKKARFLLFVPYLNKFANMVDVNSVAWLDTLRDRKKAVEQFVREFQLTDENFVEKVLHQGRRRAFSSDDSVLSEENLKVAMYFDFTFDAFADALGDETKEQLKNLYPW